MAGAARDALLTESEHDEDSEEDEPDGHGLDPAEPNLEHANTLV